MLDLASRLRSDGRVVLYPCDGGLPFLSWPVDAKVIIAQGLASLDPAPTSGAAPLSADAPAVAVEPRGETD